MNASVIDVDPDNSHDDLKGQEYYYYEASRHEAE